jgi:hypothetical protein
VPENRRAVGGRVCGIRAAFSAFSAVMLQSITAAGTTARSAAVSSWSSPSGDGSSPLGRRIQSLEPDRVALATTFDGGTVAAAIRQAGRSHIFAPTLCRAGEKIRREMAWATPCHNEQ